MSMFAPFIQYLIRSGISEYAIIMLLFLPVVTALITAARYIIGWRTINIYTTILLAYALFDLAYVRKGVVDYSSALFYGSLFIIATSVVGIMIHSWFHNVRLHYLSKVSIAMSAATVGTLVLLYISTYIDQVELNLVNPLTILLFVVSVESLVKSYVRHGVKKAFRLMSLTILLAAMLFVIMSQEVLQNALIDYPEIAGLMIVSSFLIGKWRGLKLFEYLRFNNILSQDFHDPEDLSE